MLAAAMEALRSSPPVASLTRSGRAGAVLGSIAGIAASIGAVFAEEPDIRNLDELKKAVPSLGNGDFRKRDKTSADMEAYIGKTLGRETVGILRQAEAGDDPEIKKRARLIREKFEDAIFAKHCKLEDYKWMWDKMPKNFKHVPRIHGLRYVSDFTVPPFLQDARDSRERPSVEGMINRFYGVAPFGPFPFCPLESSQASLGTRLFKTAYGAGLVRQHFFDDDFQERKVPWIYSEITGVQEAMAVGDDQEMRAWHLGTYQVLPPEPSGPKSAPTAEHAPRLSLRR